MIADVNKLKTLKTMQIKTIIFVVFFVLVVGGALFTIKTSIIKPDDQVQEVFNYSLKDTVNYKVHLYENSFYEEPYLGMDKQYAADLIKNIEIDFISLAKISKEAIIDSDYEINASINGIYSSDSSRNKTELWTKNYNLVPKTKDTAMKLKEHTIREKINIDYAYYNQIVTDFKKELRLNIDATFDITMTINYRIKVDSETLSKSEVLKLSFPLTKVAFVITTNVPDNSQETIYDYGKLIVNYYVLIPAIIFLLIAIILFVNFLKKMLKINKKTEYQIRLNKILKNFGDIIAKSETIPACSKYDIIDIALFEDLVDIENEVRIPIIYYEKLKDMEGWFTLIHGNQMYRYILYDNEIDQKIYEHTMQIKIR